MFMSLHNRLALPIALLALAFLVGCGSSSSVTPQPPPSGSFGLGNLNGTYVFSVSGIDGNAAPYALVGTFNANGSGGITGGTVDINDADLSAPAPNQPISGSSSYTVSVDGRGQAKLGISALGGTVTLDFVLQDSSHGMVTEFDTNATGSGTLDLQSAGVTPAGTYAFSFSGFDYSSGTANSFATVGNFTVSGGAISGLEDYNDGEFAYPNETLTGSIALGPSSTPATVLSTGFGTLTFDVFAIDANHLKFIETDTTANLVGDAYSQSSTSIPTGALAFTLEGSYPGPDSFSAAGGFMVTDGSGNITSSSTVDANNGGTVTSAPLNFSGTYTAGGTGRYIIALSSFPDGTSFAAYPSSGGTFLLEIDNSGILSGAAYTQTQNAFSASQGYGLNLTGANLTVNNGVEVDDIAEFTASSSGDAITGIIDENYQPNGAPTLGLALSGTYSAPDTNGRGQLGATAGTSSVSTLNGGFTLTFYSVDGTTFPFIETDANGQVTAGTFVEQNPTASTSAAMSKTHMFVVRPLIRAHANWKKQK
jgi:hypothetical protein